MLLIKSNLLLNALLHFIDLHSLKSTYLSKYPLSKYLYRVSPKFCHSLTLFISLKKLMF